MNTIVYLPLSGMKTERIAPDTWLPELESFTGWQLAASLPMTTIKLRNYHLRRFAIETGLGPFDATLDDLVRYLATHTWSPSTRRSNRTTLRAYFKWAVLNGRLDVDPSTWLPSVPTPKGRARPASDKALSVGLSSVDERIRLMVELGDRGGLRCCEIALVHSRDILGEPGGHSLLVHGKGRKERLVPIHDALARRILVADGYLFPGAIDGHISAGYVSKLLSRGMAGYATGHQLRHRAGTRWLRASGGNLRVPQELLGHASVATTEIYTEVGDDELRSAALAA